MQRREEEQRGMGAGVHLRSNQLEEKSLMGGQPSDSGTMKIQILPNNPLHIINNTEVWVKAVKT